MLPGFGNQPCGDPGNPGSEFPILSFTPQMLAEVEAEFLASVQEYRAASSRYLIPGEFVTVRGEKR
jgi:hypothetical protein